MVEEENKRKGRRCKINEYTQRRREGRKDGDSRKGIKDSQGRKERRDMGGYQHTSDDTQYTVLHTVHSTTHSTVPSSSGGCVSNTSKS